MHRRLAVLVCVLVAAALAPATAAAAPTWEPASSATVHPGVMTYTEGGQCTANFVFTDSAGAVYIGQAAHCASTGLPSQTNGCTTPSLGTTTRVDVDGAQYPGTMVYNSWVTMKAKNEQSTFTCQYNDFALVKLDSRDWGRVNPSVPHFGGPDALRTTSVPSTTKVYSYGNSGLRFGIAATSPKRGISLGTGGDGWTHSLYTVSQGIPGDSGSGLLDANGDAYGVLSTVSAAPIPLSNNAGDLNKELAYMRANATGFSSIALALGTVPFKDPIVP